MRAADGIEVGMQLAGAMAVVYGIPSHFSSCEVLQVNADKTDVDRESKRRVLPPFLAVAQRGAPGAVTRPWTPARKLSWVAPKRIQIEQVCANNVFGCTRQAKLYALIQRDVMILSPHDGERVCHLRIESIQRLRLWPKSFEKKAQDPKRCRSGSLLPSAPDVRRLEEGGCGCLATAAAAAARVCFQVCRAGPKGGHGCGLQSAADPPGRPLCTWSGCR
mmetsp:Transcript_55086/g.131269  ORF Transcript_55086/g.131269 Transcript_55086/m.131269 type:complete len:219 (-) Transcript_55086:247-903(-)